MRIERVTGKEERRVLTGMVVDTVVLGRIASKWEGGMFQSKWANVVADLCVGYFKRYRQAPGKHIEGLFDSWASEAQNKEEAPLVDKFLGSLSDEHEALAHESNSPYLIDLAGRFFNRVKLQRLAEQIDGHIDSGKVERAMEAVVKYGTGVSIGGSARVDVLNDKEALARAFAERAEPLFTVPGDLGKFFGRSFQRGGFISFLGPEKRGKTTWLVDLAWQAMLARRKVAFFAVGDEGEEDMMLRFGVRASRHSLFPDTFRYPIKLEVDDGKGIVSSEEWTYDKPLSQGMVERAFEYTQGNKIKSRKEYLALSTHSNSSLSVEMMDQELTQWEAEGFVPDVVVVDYMDILMMGGGRNDSARDRINETWKAMRGLAQRRHALVLTATQADADSYDQALMSMSNFSEDKRKVGHVTGMVGLNQIPKEKERGIMRLNWIAGRGFRYNSSRCVYCAACPEIADPAVLSSFRHGKKET